ncbi:MAG: TlpA disulfide reductase family protein [Evtepia sp.]|uniref:TlpA family protein disulfide reductase n=1 Tax=Evtepia sp. TaxID=2773933 RepID=UPI002A757F64|nr:TlpA disulfide reductase family protein [Evtepia sp.]MDY3014738.1 TlpA disulfide reductase family protein [Evtepia sp.]
MKKMTSVLVVLVLAAALLAGCGKTETTDSGAVVNKSYDVENMVNIQGEKITPADTDLLGGSMEGGFLALCPASWLELDLQRLNVYQGSNAVHVSYVSDAAMEEIQKVDLEALSQEEQEAFLDRLYNEMLYPVLSIYAVADGNREIQDQIALNYEKTETLAIANGYHYCLSYNPTLPEGIKESEKAAMEVLTGSIEEVKACVALFPPEQNTEAGGNMASLTQFTAQDMEGKTVDQSIFADYDLTMVNLWTTWCGYCVQEMPELEKLRQQLPENVNLLSICCDGNTEKELAQQILTQSGVKFQTIVANDQLNQSLVQYVSGFPTTVFVDSKGNLVGKMQAGVPRGDSVAEAYLSLINERLAQVKQ